MPSFVPLVCVVDFHHARSAASEVTRDEISGLTFMRRGPEVEKWAGVSTGDPVVQHDWSLLPFLALSDGAHA